VVVAAATALAVAFVLLPGIIRLLAYWFNPDVELRDDEGLGHGFLYTYCSASPLHLVASAALYVPLGYIQQLPEAYCELSSLCGLKTT
jgi:hypothetical protein